MATGNPQVNWHGITGELSQLLRDELSKVVSGAKADLDAFTAQITEDMVRALREGKQGMTQELRGQALALVEIHRLRVANSADDIIERVLGIAMRVASLSLGNVTGWLG